MIEAVAPGAALEVTGARVDAHPGVIHSALETSVLGDILAGERAVVAEGRDAQGFCHHVKRDWDPGYGEVETITTQVFVDEVVGAFTG